MSPDNGPLRSGRAWESPFPAEKDQLPPLEREGKVKAANGIKGGTRGTRGADVYAGLPLTATGRSNT
jgi:hypothetical protein